MAISPVFVLKLQFFSQQLFQGHEQQPYKVFMLVTAQQWEYRMAANMCQVIIVSFFTLIWQPLQAFWGICCWNIPVLMQSNWPCMLLKSISKQYRFNSLAILALGVKITQNFITQKLWVKVQSNLTSLYKAKQIYPNRLVLLLFE